MNIAKNRGSALVTLGLAVLVGSGLCAATANAADEQKFDVLQIGTQTYHNVTVTTKGKDYVFLLHSGGMANIKLKDLSPEQRLQLGYAPPPPPPKSTTDKANDWAKQSLSKIETPQVKAFAGEIQDAFVTRSFRGMQLPALSRKVIWAGAAVLGALYLFGCYCCGLICVKAGKKPGVLVWLPILQVFPMFEAAGMSAWWVLLLPIANIVWCFKIAKARGKGVGTGIMLLLPVLNIFAFLYLAFSAGGSGSAPRKDKRRIEVMSLEAA